MKRFGMPWMILSAACLTLAAHATSAATVSVTSQARPWATLVVGSQTEPERLATIDLQRYLAQVTGAVPAVVESAQWSKSPTPAVLLGRPQSNRSLIGLRIKAEGLGDEGYHLANAEVGGARVIVAAGATPAGAVNAVYGLLRELGFGFYLGSEDVPPRIPDALPTSPVRHRPALKVRGVLPWYNFFDSPTAWDPVDHRAFVDQLIRGGANFVGFHTYDKEPFGGVVEKGKVTDGERLLNTSSGTIWSNRPIKTADYGFGTSKLFAQEAFGAASTFLKGTDAEAVKHEQNILRDALDYARRRGLHACVGVEVSRDPTSAEEREAFRKRFSYLLEQYPAVDYVWIWEPEAWGALGFPRAKCAKDSKLPELAAAKREVFRRVVESKKGGQYFDPSEKGKLARAIEGVRLEQYALLALEVLKSRQHAPRLVISGWGGDGRLASAEYYEGLDRLLPKDVVFASLDNIVPRDRIDRIYSDLPPDRERWPIPWLERDGDQWHPQPDVHTHEKMMPELTYGGSQGVLGIHWRTRCIQENFAFIVRAAWRPLLTADDFFADLAHRRYGPSCGEEMAAIHAELDELGYRWVNGSGQAECWMFGWGPGKPRRVAQLKAIRQRVAAVEPKLTQGRAEWQHLLDLIDYILAYDRAEHDAADAGALLTQARDKKTDKQQARQLAAKALALLDGGNLADAMHRYALTISTRGEYGVLATMSTKAVIAWRQLRKEAIALSETSNPAPEGDWPSPPKRILLPRFLASAEPGRELVIEPIVLGGGKALLHYRALGDKDWTTQPLTVLKDWVFRGTVPAEAMKSPGIEIALSFDQAPAGQMAVGPIAITVASLNP